MTDETRVFELRTYTAVAGKAGPLHERFRDHTIDLFGRHGIEVIGFFDATEDPDVLVYLLAFKSREDAERSWAEFQADPDWISAKAASEHDGPLVAKIESRLLSPTDFSPLR